MFTREIAEFKSQKNINLNYGYQHNVMKNIYRFIRAVDMQLEKELYHNGFKLEGYTYKFFNFAVLFDKASYNSSHIFLPTEGKLDLIISGKKEIVDTIVSGIKESMELILDNKKLICVNIRHGDLNARFNKTMLYRTVSPVIASQLTESGRGYINPFDMDNFFNQVGNNALKKYKAFYGRDYDGDLFFDFFDDQVKSRTIEVHGAKIPGSMFKMFIEADIDMQKTLYYLGLGQNSSTGAGLLQIINGSQKEVLI